jgi:hypothetical protein
VASLSGHPEVATEGSLRASRWFLLDVTPTTVQRSFGCDLPKKSQPTIDQDDHNRLVSCRGGAARSMTPQDD